MKYSIAIATFAFLSFSMNSLAQEDTAEEADRSVGAESELPYQITVRGRVTRARLRNLIRDVQEDFFKKFNELNIDDAYDVHCYKYTPTMSHISHRICEPAFQIDARAENAAEAAFILGCTGICGDPDLFSPRLLHRTLKPNFEILQAKLEELTRENADFRQIGNVLAELKYRLENYNN